jgi:3-hydroxyisobutyrate dehydrogenase-like beta-hydroxyacid dehydrogenase
MKEVVYPPDGVLSGMQKGSTLVITSTLSPAEIMKVEKVTRQAGVHLIDSPVSGGQQKAREGSLTFMVGGDGEVVSGNEDVLQTMGANVTHVGKVGQGQATKLVNQMMVSANIVAVAETLVMAKKLGLDQKAVVDIISKSAGDSFVLRTMAPSMIERDFTARAAVSIFTKDTGIIMNTAQELNVPLLVSSAAYNISRVAESRGFAEQDMTVVIKVFEELAGVADDDRA